MRNVPQSFVKEATVALGSHCKCFYSFKRKTYPFKVRRLRDDLEVLTCVGRNRNGTCPRVWRAPPCSSTVGFMLAHLWQETRVAEWFCENVPHLIHQWRKWLSLDQYFALDPLQMQSYLHHVLMLCSLHVQAAFQSFGSYFIPPPRSLPPSPAFAAPSYISLLRANNCSPCLGTSVLK